MKFSLPNLLLTGFFLLVMAQMQALHPAFQAPLYDHMVEVNKEWLHQAEPIGDLAAPMSFSNDIERIQTHLRRVEEILRARTKEMNLSSSQRKNRLAMLDALMAYYTEAQFPKNTNHSFRIPYFIDEEGTPCAVGHLLIESGFEEVAERVRAEMNNAYVREIPYEELPIWAEKYGFELSELAWIQPGYPPANKWTPVGGTGANAPGHVIIKDTANNGIIVLGSFTEFNGVACHGAVRIDDHGTTALDTFPLSGAKTATFYKGKLWAGGFFPGPMGFENNLMTYDGNKWTRSYVGFGPVNCLHVHDGKLYAGGDFPSAIFDNLAIYDEVNGGWSPFASYLGPVNTMTSYKGELVVGGDFSAFLSHISYIARWDGMEWKRLESAGDTLDSPVRSLFVDGQTLYAGGGLVDSLGRSHFGLASITNPADGWQHLLPNYTIFFPFPSLDSAGAYISDVQKYGDRLYISGSFLGENGLSVGTNMGIYDTLFGGFIDPIGNFSAPVLDMLIAHNKVYATGAFNNPAGFVLETDALSNGLPEDPRFDDLVVYPNPAQDFVILRWDAPTQGMDLNLDLYDFAGRKIKASYEQTFRSIRLDRGQLAAGAYAFVLKDGTQPVYRGRVIFR